MVLMVPLDTIRQDAIMHVAAAVCVCFRSKGGGVAAFSVRVLAHPCMAKHLGEICAAEHNEALRALVGVHTYTHTYTHTHTHTHTQYRRMQQVFECTSIVKTS